MYFYIVNELNTDKAIKIMPEKQKAIIRVIALEEAFLHPKLRALCKPSYVEQLDLLKDRLTDVGPERIKLMDAAGIDLLVLSHVAPGVQLLDCETAIRLSIEINDWLFEAIKEYDSFAPILECAQTLDVPTYIHPTDPP
jgi:predicted TIM-barrel fold metal-dependent hydrolase